MCTVKLNSRSESFSIRRKRNITRVLERVRKTICIRIYALCPKILKTICTCTFSHACYADDDNGFEMTIEIMMTLSFNQSTGRSVFYTE